MWPLPRSTGLACTTGFLAIAARPARARVTIAAVALAAGAGCGGAAVTLHSPSIAASTARSGGARIDFEPMTTHPAAAASIAARGGFGRCDPAAVLTSGIQAELGGRALRDGDPHGYVVRCALERFALRTQSNVAGTRAYAALYVDLACEAESGTDRAMVWRGAVHARDAATGGGTFGREPATMQRLVDRLVSDATRELASDIAVRALGLSGEPSARVFADEAERAEQAGIVDAPGGLGALSESADAAALATKALHHADPLLRAAAWNVIAMAAGPGERAAFSTPFALDEDILVRFYQYKALGRLASAEALAQLRAAATKEEESLLADLARDAVATDGIGFARTNATAATNGATTSP